ncbi:MAG: hypothetical protein ABI229_07025 [Gemmatimonadaceae bacterium]
MRESLRSRVQTRTRHGVESRPASKAERLLRYLGADPAIVDAMLGDLAEERVSRTELHGERGARCWYFREVLCSTPHLLAHAVHRASWRGRTLLVMGLAGVALAVTFAVPKLFDGPGAPAQLLVGDLGGALVVNNERPVQLTMRVLDASGRSMSDSGVAFLRVSGPPFRVSAKGIATCTQSGDAVVRASLGALTTPFLLRCRPVRDVRGLGMLNLVAGGPAADVPFVALDGTGQPVTLLRGDLTIKDSSVATLDVTADGHSRVRGHAAGITTLRVHIGDREAFIGVHVYEHASSLDGIRPDQELAIPVTLAAGEVRQWRLPAAREEYFIVMRPGEDGQRVPRLAIVGANCSPVLDAQSFFCIAQHEASLFVFRSRGGDQTRTAQGMLTVWRMPQP